MADKEMMKILVLEPEKTPYTAEISNDYKSMQSVVGGLIEPIYFEPEGDALIFCNEEFLLNGSKPNRIVGGVLVHGTCFVVGNCQNRYGEWDSRSLTDEQISKYSDEFYTSLALNNMNFECDESEEICDTEIQQM